MLKPSKCRPANVPINDTGTASSGMMVARQLCKKRYTTKNTSTIASAKVLITSLIDCETKGVVSYGVA